MLAAINQATSTTQFYLYGKKHCTRTGWEAAQKQYAIPDILQNVDLDLSGKVYMITGANAGIGREITNFVESKAATVYMVCRSPTRAEAALNEIIEHTKNQNVHLIIGDCGVESEIRTIWQKFVDHRQQSSSDVTLDGLVCNAGVLKNELTLTKEGIEETFATHLLFGTYLLGSLALPTLAATPQSRLIVVSSGGMYNTKFPSWDDATSVSCTGASDALPYNGQMVYAYAKRGQVLLCEEWAKQYKDRVKVVSCHPGWTQTEALDAAYGSKKKYLEPLRSTWEGAEGIVYLLVTPDVAAIEDGGFYLDRSPQMKHLPGLIFGENTFTMNTPEEVADMMDHLAQWSSAETRATEIRLREEEKARQRPLTAMNEPIDISWMMADWRVLAHIPTVFEVNGSNMLEKYSWSEEKQRINVEFEFFAQGATEPTHFRQRAHIVNAPLNTQWAIDPKVLSVYLPLGLSYLVLDAEQQMNEADRESDSSYVMVGVPNRNYLWIMSKATPSEYDQPGVTVLAAYPGLMESSDSISTANNRSCAFTASSEHKGEAQPISKENATSGAELVCENDALANRPQDDGNPVAKVLAAADTAQTEKRLRESAILRRALTKAAVLGYDISRVLRVPWSGTNAPGGVAMSVLQAEQQQQQQQQGDGGAGW